MASRLGSTSTGRATLVPLRQELVKLYREIGKIAQSAAKSRIDRLEHLISKGRSSAPDKSARSKTTGKRGGSSRPAIAR